MFTESTLPTYYGDEYFAEACKTGDIEALKWFIENGRRATVNDYDLAQENGHTKACEILLAGGKTYVDKRLQKLEMDILCSVAYMDKRRVNFERLIRAEVESKHCAVAKATL